MAALCAKETIGDDVKSDTHARSQRSRSPAVQWSILDGPIRAASVRAQSGRMAARLHLHFYADAVDDLIRGVADAPRRLWRHMHDKAAFSIPALDRFHNIAIGGQRRAVRRDVVHRPVQLVEDEHRGPPVMMDRLLVAPSIVTSRTRSRSFSKRTLWCFGAAVTASKAGSQLDGSEFTRSVS